MSTATIVIKNETNCKIDGLSPEVRRELSKKFKFEIPGARYTPAVKLGRWDGMMTFFNIAADTYINLLPEIIPIIIARGYEVAIDDRRAYTIQYELEPIQADTFADRTWPEGHNNAGEPIIFRDYQVQVINEYLTNPQSIQEVATGAGKTLITAALSLQCEEHGRTIVIVPNKSLVTQTEDDYRNLGLDVGVYYGKRKEFGHKHTICTWQSLNILQKKAEAATENATVASLRDPTNVTINDFLEDVICVIVDEVHAAKADALRNLLTGSMSKLPIRWGLTGTVPKDDCFRISLICSIGSVTNKLSARELQDMDVLSDCHIHVRQLMDHKAYQNYQDELRYLLEDKKRMEYIGEMISKIAAGGNTLVLIDRVKPGKDLVGMIDEAVFVFGNTKDTTRKEHYDDVATASNKVIVATYGVAAVGINLPRIFNLVLIEPGKSFVRVIQSIGRGIRKAEDKDHVDIYDITSNCKFAKRHLTTRKKFYREAEYEFSIEKIDWQK